jgi:hypothetical protein
MSYALAYPRIREVGLALRLPQKGDAAYWSAMSGIGGLL